MALSALRRCWLSLAVAVAAACASCTSSSPATPSFFVGAPSTTYAGSVEDSARGAGTATMTLATVQGITSGNVDMTFATAEARRVITGSVTNGVYAAKFSSCPGTDVSCSGCEFSFVGSVSRTAISGSYAEIVTQFCSARTGTMTLTAR
jgi:hypothetical protein